MTNAKERYYNFKKWKTSIASMDVFAPIDEMNMIEGIVFVSIQI